MPNRKHSVMSHFIRRSFGTLKLTETTSDLTSSFRFRNINRASRNAFLITERMLSVMESFIPPKNTNEPKSQPLITLGCCAVIVTGTTRERCSMTFDSFRTTGNHCNIVLDCAKKKKIMQSIKNEAKKKILGFSEFWKVRNKILNRGKASVQITFPLIQHQMVRVNLPDFLFLSNHNTLYLYSETRGFQTLSKASNL